MRRPRAGLFWLLALVVAAEAILAGLGVWQLQRLAWKTGVIAQIEARAEAAPEPLPPQAEWGDLRPDDYEYRHVWLSGRYENDKEALVFRASGGPRREPGYLVLAPLRLRSGAYVLVNRGFVPLDRKNAETRSAGNIEGETRVTGLMRRPEPRNFFTPRDDPASGSYFTRDPGLIAAHFALAPAAPFSIDADDAPVPGGWPKGGATELAIPNNHLSYALTWFGLGLSLAGVFGAYAWSEFRSRA
ncbi:SURF1 family protein [Methylocapsa acidiphila]|uniref:SURF1 family protein n=1 Tax=Methylocapsa acidiphila TaxID=133552 RepID=UPI000410DD99|nr:SURF1 family protein [Methylocapsa acidiphila]